MSSLKASLEEFTVTEIAPSKDQHNNSGEVHQEKAQMVWDEGLQQDYERILSVGEECITPTELRSLLLRKGRGSGTDGFVLYDGFEPSGRMHIAQGVFKAMNVNKCTASGNNGTFVFWVADWFALMNDKMGGDLEKIKVVGQYLIEVWRAAGMDLTNVVFKWASDEITKKAGVYWPLVLDVARRFTVTRIKKCCQIMGRLEGSLTAAQILYPLMQCTDVFFLNADICQLGVDQRKVNMLAREYCDSAKRKHKPIILSHHMLYGLKAGQAKMSKSDPDSAIFMEDSPEDVRRKINNAYCPRTVERDEQQHPQSSDSTTTDAGKESLQLVEDQLKNPCLDYIKNIIFSPPNAVFTVVAEDISTLGSMNASTSTTSSDPKGTQETTDYHDYESVRLAFVNGTISESQLKHGLICKLNDLLEPVRYHFSNHEHAKNLLQLVQQYKRESASANTISTAAGSRRRLDVRSAGLVPADVQIGLVFGPMPTGQPTLQMAMDTLFRIRAGLQSIRSVETGTSKCVLYLQDWSATVTNACNADTKAVKAFYAILLASLRALDGVMARLSSTLGRVMDDHVLVLYQSDVILSDPSNYWISVINIGRHFTLQRVMGESLQDEDNAGHVVARLMQVADVTAIQPNALVLHSSISSHNTDKSQQIQLPSLESQLVTEFFNCKLPTLILPNILHTSCPSLRLQPLRESDAFQNEYDEYFLLDDPKVHGKSKMKKSFCEPGNISFCPPISLASVFALLDFNESTFGTSDSEGVLEIKRTDENGGNVVYTTKKQLEHDFALGESVLHPGDLKNSVTTLMLSVLEAISSGIQNDKTATAASKTLKAFVKKKK